MDWAAAEGMQSVDILQHMENKDYREYRVEGDGHPNGRAFAQAAAIFAPIIAESLWSRVGIAR